MTKARVTKARVVKRIAVVLFNLGGPDSPQAVRPFLFNLFNDRAIIDLPNPLRWLLARFIAARRAPVAREIYRHLGGKSPLLELTLDQAAALQTGLADRGDVRCFVAMRYWHPMIAEVVGRVRDFAPDAIVLLPLYPQFSTTTTGSSLREWSTQADRLGWPVEARAICCYPDDPGWIAAQADVIKTALAAMDGPAQTRVLFSAHGLPEKIIAKGDPYQHQVERTVRAIVHTLDPETGDAKPGDAKPGDEKAGDKKTDWAICYQSRVGRLQWIGPSTDDELRRAATDGVQVLVVPVAFVSEHSETLVELDIEYGELAKTLGISVYRRVPAVGTHPAFIGGLSRLVGKALDRPGPICSICSGGSEGQRICAPAFSGCPLIN